MGKCPGPPQKRTVDKYGSANTRLLFTDTLIEDADLYRFLQEGAANVGAELVWLKDGRTPWQVFDDVKVLGNSRMDPCSRVLKRELAQKWLDENCDPRDTALAFGIDWTEGHRFDDGEGHGVRPRYHRLGWPLVEAPMMDAPFLGRADIAAWLAREGIERARLYKEGFTHNNCGGGCVKAGKGHWAHVLRRRPEVFAEWEAGEIAFNAKRPGKKFQTIVQDVKPAPQKNVPVRLSELRKRIERQEVDLFDIGGCGCFVSDGEDIGNGS